MKKMCSDVSSRVKEIQSSAGVSSLAISLPNITNLMRNEFLPLMQCLSQSDDILYKTYTVELALTLVSLDASLKEEEKRIFVCAFDTLSRQLLKDLHHFIEVEAFLQQDMLLLLELVERCRMVENIYNSCVRSNSGLRGAASTSSYRSNLANTSVPVMESKGQQLTPEITETGPVNCSSTELQQLFLGNMNLSNMSRQLYSGHSKTNSTAASINGQLNEITQTHVSRSASPSHRIFQQPSPVGTVPLQGIPSIQNFWKREEFREFLEGRVPKSDLIALLNILNPKNNNNNNNNNNKQSEGSSKDDVKLQTNVKSTHTNSSGNNNNNNNNNNRVGVNTLSVDNNFVKRGPQIPEENDNFTRVGENSKLDEAIISSSNFVCVAGGKVVNQTAVHIKMLLEWLLYGGPSGVASLNSSFGSIEDAEQINAAFDNSVEQRININIQLGETVGRPIASPSHSALSLFIKLFPSIHNYEDDFTKFAECTIGENGLNNIPSSLCDNSRRLPNNFQRNKFSGNGGGVLAENLGDVVYQPLTANLVRDNGGNIRPVDILLFSILQSFKKIDIDNNSTFPITSDNTHINELDESIPRTSPNISDSVGISQTQQQQQNENNFINLPHLMGIEFENMIKEIQESISSVQGMQEQIREEITLLVFRVITTVEDILIPAVKNVDRRETLFYRKWICDMYRLLWEEDILNRFSSIMNKIQSSSSIENSSFSTNPQSKTVKGKNKSKKNHIEKGESSLLTNSTSNNPNIKIISNNSCTPLSNIDNSIINHKDNKNSDTNIENSPIYISPGNAYSHARRHLFVNFSSSDEILSNVEEIAFSSNFLGNTTNSNTVAISSEVNHNNKHNNNNNNNLDLFDDPAVIVAGSLLANAAIETPPLRGFLITRLMAALLHGMEMSKLRHLSVTREFKERSFISTIQNEFYTNVPVKTLSATRVTKQTVRKKKTPSPNPTSSGVLGKPSSLSSTINNITAENKKITVQKDQTFCSFNNNNNYNYYPLVSNAEDVQLLFMKVLRDAEVLLSPLDPIRAAIVQNTVDYLVTGMRNPKEAYEILDSYLDDVQIEPIQRLIPRRVNLDGNVENSHNNNNNNNNNNNSSHHHHHHISGIHSTSLPDSPFSVTTVRRAQQMPSDNIIIHTGKINSTPSKRGGTIEKEINNNNNNSNVLKLPFISNIIPSWTTTEETEQFLAILALLHREYITLRSLLGIANSPSRVVKKDNHIK